MNGTPSWPAVLDQMEFGLAAAEAELTAGGTPTLDPVLVPDGIGALQGADGARAEAILSRTLELQRRMEAELERIAARLDEPRVTGRRFAGPSRARIRPAYVDVCG